MMDIKSLRLKALPTVLKHYGRNPKNKTIICLNPAHNDDKPSMQVNLDTGRVFCHGCGWLGDSIDLVTIIGNLDWNQGVAKVASLC